MFVNISNGNVSCRVSKGAFDNYYKSIGYSIVDEGSSYNKPIEETNYQNDVDVEDTSEVEDVESVEEVDVVDEENENDVFVEEIMEKPISQWSNEELKKFATIKGIDTSSAKKVSEARNIIKEYLVNEEKNKVAED